MTASPPPIGPPRQRGSAALFVPELLMRQVIEEGAVALAGDPTRLSELFYRPDDLFGASSASWTEGMKKALLAMISETPTRGGLTVSVGYPMREAVLPCISLVTESDGENDSEGLAGNNGGQAWRTTGIPVDPADPAASRALYRTEAWGWRTVVQVGAWSTQPEGAALLSTLARYLLLTGQGQLSAAGVHELSVDGSGFEPTEHPLYPAIPYVPLLRVTLLWTLRATGRIEPQPRRVTVSVRGCGR